MIRSLLICVLIAAPCFGQSVYVEGPAGTPSTAFPARGELVCTYFQPIVLVNRGVIDGGSDQYSWEKEAASEPITGEAAVHLVPRFRWEYMAGSTVQTLFGMATHSGFSRHPRESGSDSPGSDPQASLTVRWDGDQRYWRCHGTWYLNGPSYWYPFVGFEGSVSGNIDLASWSIEIAGDYVETHDNVSAPSTSIDIYINPSRTATKSGGSVLRIKHGTDFGKPFKWLTLEVREWSYTAESGGGMECCEEIIDELQDIETILQAMNVRDSLWMEAWETQNTNLMQWKTDWVAQDEWLRPVLEALKLGIEDDDTSPTLPSLPEYITPDAPRRAEDLVGGLQTTFGDVVAKPKLFSGLGDETDNEDAPVWVFYMPSNPLASMGGPPNVNRAFTVNFSLVPNFAAVLVLIQAVMYLWTAIWGVSHIWEELRKY